ncbi:bifunctional (p)ppGpp synthetase/guanosine-3',5'-bis(diphosphate) 3'-pyrophosphohydrolase [symbiont of Argiope bruennichi]|uniref:RelA/SpoT family protein n=1 Tax=symbiont of Argiope bruennichi TaxID=2810479 RepID=UPI003DA38AE3
MIDSNLYVSFETFLNNAKKIIKKESQLKLIIEALNLSKEIHKDQKRSDNTPYIYHPLTVANIIVEWNFGYLTIISALLHDIVEDHNYPLLEIEKKFGKEIAFLVDSLTKVSEYEESKNVSLSDKNLKKIIIGMSNDIRVIIVKLADRLHNLRTIKFLSKEKQKKIAEETLAIYIPISRRLGLQKLTDEMSDIVFKILNPNEYQKIKLLMKKTLKQRDLILKEIITTLQNIFNEKNLKIEKIYGRAKHFYSIYKKMIFTKKQFNELYDLQAIRIITLTKDDCYLALGYIHEKFVFLSNSFKDYIARPKPNGYQSIHTSIIFNKEIIEVQIRTKKMNQVAEYGIAAHWLYKENKNPKNIQENELKLHLSSILSDFSDEDSDNVSDYIKKIKEDVLQSSIYVVTPKGDTITLVKHATVLDFAYHIHTKIGEKAINGIVNGVIKPLNYQLKSGDVVEIRTNNLSHPNIDWLKKVTTNSAISKIKKYLKNELEIKNNQFRQSGKKILQIFLEKNKEWKAYFETDEFKKKANLQNETNLDNFYLSIGKKQINLKNFFQNLLRSEKKKKLNQTKSQSSNNFFDLGPGYEGIKTNLAKCCYPVKGDLIVGVVGKNALNIHRKECPNYLKLQDKNRIIEDINWKKNINFKFCTSLSIIVLDNPGILAFITAEFQKFNINIDNIIGKKVLKNNNFFRIKLIIKVSDLEVLTKAVQNISKNKNIIKIERSFN